VTAVASWACDLRTDEERVVSTSSTILDAALARRPDLGEPLDDLLATLRRGPLEPALLDTCEALVRHRIGVPAARPVPDVGDRRLDARTRAVLVMTEQFVIDPQGIGTDMRDAVLDHFSLGELATLVQAVAMFDALARMEAVLTPAAAAVAEEGLA
jgi:alkylhydroperoxidase family enzyme